MAEVPVVDVGPLLDPAASDRAEAAVGAALDAACRRVGFFTVTGHGVPAEQLAELDRLARAFFARPEAEKAEVAMARAGRRWRGWFPLDGELTSGVPDHKEGVYFGRELPAEDPRVRAGLPLHGPNQFPAEPGALGPAVLAWLDAMEALGQAVLGGLAVGLGLDRTWFADGPTRDPTTLFRIFRYPPVAHGWGVAEHTDYGLLTILAGTDLDGLEVRVDGHWQPVDPPPGAFVCNLGDMLDRMTGGRYRSTPHRVLPPRDRDRVSFPFFLDPGWDAVVEPLDLGGPPPADDVAERWDRTSVHELPPGTYGDYLTAKVARVFPDLVS